jgi:hypothetical protein
MDVLYHVRKRSAAPPDGPFTLQAMRAMVRSAELGKRYSVSKDGGRTWLPAETFDELWDVRDLTPRPAEPPPAAAAPSPSSPPGRLDPPVTVPWPVRNESTSIVRRDGDDTPPPPHRGGRGMAVAGFVTTLAALVLSLVPAFIWVMRHGTAYGFMPVVFPLLVASVVGLVLSAVGMARRAGAFAMSGMILGICGAVVGLVTSIGWTLSPDPRYDWIDRITKTQDADLQLARRHFDSSLKRYRDSGNDDRDKALERLTKDFMLLAHAHHKLLKAAASTPRFRPYLEDLESLHVAFDRYRDSIRLRDDLEPQAAIRRVGEDVAMLGMLLDIQELYRTRQMTLEMAQAKFRDL